MGKTITFRAMVNIQENTTVLKRALIECIETLEEISANNKHGSDVPNSDMAYRKLAGVKMFLMVER